MTQSDSPRHEDLPLDEHLPLGTQPTGQEETVEEITEDVRSEIRLGHVEDDVTHVLEERLDEAGVHLRPEKVDDLAEDIENDVST